MASSDATTIGEAVQANGEDSEQGSSDNITNELRESLSVKAARVMALFREWDDDESGKVSKKDFRKAAPVVSARAFGQTSRMDAIFDEWDPLRSGLLELDVLESLLRGDGETKGAAKSVAEGGEAGADGDVAADGVAAGMVVAAEATTEKTILQVLSFLSSRADFAMKTLREWDAEDGTGSVTMRDFRKLLAVLGVTITKAQADKVFGVWDKTQQGAIPVSEFETKLGAGAPTQIEPPKRGSSAQSKSAPRQVADTKGSKSERPKKPAPDAKQPSSAKSNPTAKATTNANATKSASATKPTKPTTTNATTAAAAAPKPKAGAATDTSRPYSAREGEQPPWAQLPPTAQNIAHALAPHRARMLELAKAWDEAERGFLSAKEFGQLLSSLGVEGESKVDVAAFGKCFVAQGSHKIDCPALASALLKFIKPPQSKAVGSAGHAKSFGGNAQRMLSMYDSTDLSASLRPPQSPGKLPSVNPAKPPQNTVKPPQNTAKPSPNTAKTVAAKPKVQTEAAPAVKSKETKPTSLPAISAPGSKGNNETVRTPTEKKSEPAPQRSRQKQASESDKSKRSAATPPQPEPSPADAAVLKLVRAQNQKISEALSRIEELEQKVLRLSMEKNE